MERVQGFGGVFVRSKDRKALAEWYRDMLGVPMDPAWFGHSFAWSEQDRPATASSVFSVFAPDTDYFGSRENTYMINFRVRDLDAMLAQLRAAGADVSDDLEASDYGRFSWVTDPEGNRVELWEPPA
ncbi:MAG: putative enzyme related to lactoylglutathione lyase [Myxococcota bacterium]|jgi:predicted enzyme related to lactoylglutathione lyase